MIDQTMENLWFWLFWVLIIVLPAMEYIHPRSQHATDWDERWTVNIGFGVLNGALTSIAPALAVVSAGWAEQHGVGLLNWVAAPGWIVVVATVAVRSLADYVSHVLMHQIPLFWRLHRIHHSDQSLNVSTGLRFHPLEVAASALYMAPIALAFGLSPAVLAVYAVVESVLALLSHADFRIPDALDRGLGRLFITPHIHRIHHSADQPETDSNYGNVFTIWDRLFGTYRAEARLPDSEMRFGLDDIDRAQANDFLWQITSPALPAQLPPRAAGSNRP